MIGERSIDGIPALTLATRESGGIEATFVPNADFVGCSLRHRGDELLGQRGGLRTYIKERSTMGIPLLYPWANRLAKLRFSVAGGEVDLEDAIAVTRDPNGLPMHGLLAAAQGWRVDRHEATEGGGVLAASFDFAGHRELMAAFPFPHEVQIEANLRGGDPDHHDHRRRHGKHPRPDLVRIPPLPPSSWCRSLRVGAGDAGE